MRKGVLISAIVILLIGLVSGQLMDSAWPTFHGNNQRTGLSPYNTSHVNGTVSWKFKTGSGIESSPVIDREGTIYFGTTDCEVYAISKQGDLKWKTKIGTPQIKGYGGSREYTCIPGTASIDSNGNIYITTRDQKIVALDSEGNVLWEFIINLTPDQFGSPAIGSDGTIYVLGSPPEDGYKEDYQIFGGYDDTEYIKDNPPLGGLYALNPDGTQKWHYEVNYRMFNSPALDKNGLIYIAVSTDYNERKLIVLNQDGNVARKIILPMEVESSPAIADDGTVYIGSFDQDETGAGLFSIGEEEVNWHYTVGQKEIFTTPAINSDGTVYIGSMVNKIFAINSDGTEKWSLDVGGTIESSISIGADGTIYFGVNGVAEDKPNIYAINPDGTVKWDYSTEMLASIMGTPAIGSDGTVYVAAWDGNLYAFGGPEEKAEEEEEDINVQPEIEEEERGFFSKIISWFRGLFGSDEISVSPQDENGTV